MADLGEVGVLLDLEQPEGTSQLGTSPRQQVVEHVVVPVEEVKGHIGTV